MSLLKTIEVFYRTTPDSIAVVQGSRSITYKELWEAAWDLSKTLGVVETEDVIGVSTRRNIEFIISIVAVHMADAAYFPIDPALPEERMSFLLSKTKARHIIFQPEDDTVFSGRCKNPVSFRYEEQKDKSKEPVPEFLPKSSLAYLLSTSGSTGEPKIAAIEHASVLALLEGYNTISAPRQKVCALALCPFSFDVSVWEIYTALTQGGTVVLLDENQIKNPDLIAHEIKIRNVTTAYVPPLMLLPLLDALKKEENKKTVLERILVGVEPIAQGVLQQWQEHIDGLLIVNGYGPTEATICSTFYKFEGTDTPELRTPIGRPVKGWAIALVDEQLKPVPRGETGEIVIAGPGLMRGYIGQDDKDYFVSLPDADLVPAGVKNRWYKSGDFARLDDHENIVYCGRKDEQIKIRGFRVDLTEIETAVKKDEEIKTCLVLAPDMPEGKRIYLFVESENRSSADIYEHLAALLPPFMRPARIEVLQAFPLTKNGKIDRKQLMALTRKRPLETPLKGPKTDTEALFLDLWKDILALDEIGIEDDFFELGGDSKLALSLSIKMANAVDLPEMSAHFLKCKTIAQSAKEVEQYKTQGRIDQENKSAVSTPLLTDGQKGLWTYQQLNPEDTAFALPVAVLFKGVNLDLDFLKNRIKETVNRYDAFHVREALENNTTLVWSRNDAAIFFDDDHCVDEGNLAEEITAIAHHDRHDVIAQDSSLVRIRFVETSNGNLVVLFTMHHIVIDGESMRIIVQDILKHLGLEEMVARSSDTMMQDFCIEYHNRKESEEYKSQKDYWDDVYSTVPEPLTLWPRKSGQALSVISDFKYIIEPKTRSKIHALSKACSVSQFEVMFSMASAMMHRMSGQDDFVLCSPVSLRGLHSKFVEAVGYFVNLVPSRIKTMREENVCDFIERISCDFRSAKAHALYPFEEILKDFSSRKDIASNDLTRFVIAEDVALGLPAIWNDVEIEELNVSKQHPMYELALFVSLDGDVPFLKWEYDSSVYAPETIETLNTAFVSLLNDIEIGAQGKEQQTLQTLSLMPEDQKQDILDRAEKALSESMPEESLIALFDEYVAHTPDAVAIETEQGEQITYRDLNDRAGFVAQALQETGIETGAPVLLLSSRTPDLIINMLGILKAGACYIPLDERVPAQRIIQIAERAGAKIALCSEPFDHPGIVAVKEQMGDDLSVLNIESGARIDHLSDVGKDTAQRTLETPAYIMFTSGSTGEPKGVVVPDRGIIRLAKYPNFAEFSEKDTFMLLSNISFDAATLEIWGALLNGGKLFIPNETSIKDPEKLIHLLAQSHITAGFFNVTLFRWITEIRPDAFKTMHTILVGGEQVPPELMVKAAETLPYHTLLNGYGPTENTTFTCCYRFTKAPDPACPVPVGYPLSYSETLVLDETMSPVPVGAVGEIVAAGAGVALGYINDPPETQKRFVKDEKGRTWYKTGDLGRYGLDGEIICLGRMDDQIKIRGFRIEIGEIEAAIRKQAGVKDVIVLAVDAEAGKRLEAYLEGDISVSGLKQDLKTILPDYMVPDRILVMDKMPVNQNGKKDKKALIEFGKRNGQQEIKADIKAPSIHKEQGEIFETLHGLFAESLNIAHIGPEEKFFDMGVNSLLLVILAKRIGKLYDLKVSAVDLLDNPTLLSLTQYIRSKTMKASGEIQESGALDITQKVSSKESDMIAVVGMSGRFSGCHSIEEYWQHALDGIIDITTLTPSSDDEIPYRGILEGTDKFDPGFFNIPDHEAEIMDPQQRVLLEVSQNAIDDAAIHLSKYERFSVYAASAPAAVQDAETSSLSEQYEHTLAKSSEFVALKLSYRLNLKGESVTVQTGCSSSLVAVHMACQSLLRNQAGIAMAAGVSFAENQKEGYFYEPGMITSPTGQCRPFDEKADGIVPGGGAAAVVLMRLSDALEQGHEIHAVIRATALNNDGASKVGFMAPSPSGQAGVIKKAQRLANVAPHEIAYVETHGTGTDLGDAIEVEGLSRVFGEDTEVDCALGSTKANSGHMDRAAGISGLIRAVMAVKTGKIPPMAGFSKLNARFDLDQVGLRIPVEQETWPKDKDRRIAGVSSFGVGGTNAHAIVESVEPYISNYAGQVTDYDRGAIVPLSATSVNALSAQIDALAKDWKEHSYSLNDVSQTLIRGRKHRAIRAAFYAKNKDEAIGKLSDLPEIIDTLDKKKVIWAFSGQGDAFIDGYPALYEKDEAYRKGFEECALIVKEQSGVDVASLLFGSSESKGRQAFGMIEFQLCMFTVQWAHVCFWRNLGWKPDAVLGHSLGEIIAATVAGVFSLDDAIKLVFWRSSLMEASEEAAMLSVNAPVKDLEGRLPDNVYISGINGKNLTILAGAKEGISVLEKSLEKENVTARRLSIPRAAHSPYMNKACAELKKKMSGIQFSAPNIPLVSNITGTWADSGIASASYWGDHLINPVQFSDSLELLRTEMKGGHVLVLGSAKSMAHMISYEIAQDMGVVTYLEHEQDDEYHDLLGRAASLLWSIGEDVDLESLANNQPRYRLQHLPGAVFDHSKTWTAAYKKTSVHSDLGKTSHAADRIKDSGAWLWETEEQEIALSEHPYDGSVLTHMIALSEPLPEESALEALCANGPMRLCCSITNGKAVNFANTHRIAALARKTGKDIILCPFEDGKEPDGLLSPGAVAQAIQKTGSLEFSGTKWISVFKGEKGKDEFETVLARLIQNDDLPEDIEIRDQKAFGRHYVHSWPDWESRPLRDGGLYVITGGAGRVSRSIVRAIAAKVKATIVLLGRRLEAQAENDLSDIRSVLDRDAVSIRYESIDIEDKEAMSALFDRLRQEFGRIDGVVHAAAVTDTKDFSLMDSMSDETLNNVISSKILGCHSIDEALAEDDADFVMLCSSLSTILGGVGFSSYIAANIYLDEFAIKKARQSDKRWISVAWDAWTDRDGSLEIQEEGPGKFALSDEDGMNVFWRLLSSRVPHIFVSTGDIQNRRESARQDLSGEQDSVQPETEKTVPSLTPEMIKTTVYDVVASVLGKTPDDPAKDLREEGIESLTILQIVTRLKKRLSVALPLADAMRNLSLEGLQKLIQETANLENALPLFEVKKAAPADVYPASCLQRRWLVLMPEKYGGLDIIVEAKGKMDAVSVSDAVRKVIYAHSALRTRFPKNGEDWLQLIEDDARVTDIDLTSYAPEEQIAFLKDFTEKQTEAWFDVENIVPFEITVGKLSEDRHVIIIHAHHVLFDGTSSSIFLRDVADAFEGKEITPEFQYVDYSEQQIEYLNSDDFLPFRAFWKKEFEGAPLPTRVPPDFPDTAESHGDDRGDFVLFKIEADIMNRIRKIAQDKNATSFILMMAAFGLLLKERTGDDDLVLGTTTAGRPNEATENIMGVFVNPLPLRLSISDEISFESYIEYVRKVLLNLHEYQHYPMEDLTVHVPPFLGLGLNDTFQCYILYQNYWRPEESSLTFEKMDVGAEAHHKLMREYELVLEDDGEAVIGEFWYRPSRFEKETIERDSKRFVEIITALSEEKLPENYDEPNS